MVHLIVRLTRLEGKDPPYDHNFLLGSAVYHLLQAQSEEVSKAVHDSPYRSAYVLSEVHRVTGRPREAWFRAGTGHHVIAGHLAKALAPGTIFEIGPATFQTRGLDLEEPSATPGEYVTLSPILLRDKDTGRSLVHDFPRYPAILETAANVQVKNYLHREGTIRIGHFEPQAVRRRTIAGRTVLAQKGRFLAEGTEDELRLLIDQGIGLSPALGFGMVLPTEGRWHG